MSEMKIPRDTVKKYIIIFSAAWLCIEVIFPVLHIAIPGRVWTTTPPFHFKRLSFSPETELDQSEIPATQSDRINEVSGLAWSSDGKYLLVVSFGNRRLNTYNTANWQLIATTLRDQYIPGGQLFFQFVPNKDIILTPVIHLSPPNTNSLQEWNFNKNSLVENFDSGFSNPVDNHYNSESVPHTVAVSKDGALVAISVVAEHGDVLIFQTKTSKIVQKIHCQYRVIPYALAFSADGKTIVMGDCHLDQVSFFDIKTGNLEYETNVGRPWTYNFISDSPNGTEVAIASKEAVTSNLTVLDATDGHFVRQFPSRRAIVTNLQWVDNSTILASYDDHNPDGSMAILWNVSTGKAIEKFGRPYMALAALNDKGDRLAIASGSIVQVFRVKK